MADVAVSERTIALNQGEIESRTLNEILKIDFDVLLTAIAPEMALPEFGKDGISAKMQMSGKALFDHLGPSAIHHLKTHRSDTVRGFAIYAMANMLDDADVPSVLAAVRPLAADPHFGVREWAWLAMRPRLVRDLEQSIGALQPWTQDRDPLIRRFAVEALRPRGVWCKAIAELRTNPSLGLPLLEPMWAEKERYPQDSVANWLNDAAKDHPEWVSELCRKWLSRSDGNKATARIAARAVRSIKS